MSENSENTNSSTALAEISREFLAARNEDSDRSWAEIAYGRFIADSVEGALARNAMAELLPTLRNADEPAKDLFGDPRHWAREQQERWREAGVLAYGTKEASSLPEFLRSALLKVIGMSIVMAVIWGFSDGWMTEFRYFSFLFPIFIGFMSSGLVQCWQVATRKHSRRTAIAITGGYLAGCVLVLTAVALVAKPIIGTAPTLWLLAPIPLYVLLAQLCKYWALKRPRKAENTATGSEPSDAEWMRRLQENLRMRGDQREDEIRAIIDQAAAHAREAGASLSTEFGAPENYASRFRPRDHRKALLPALGYTAAAALGVVAATLAAFDEGTALNWRTAIYTLLLFLPSLGFAVHYWRQSFKRDTVSAH